VGVGLVLSAVSMAVAGLVEVKRRDQALKGHLISLFWLSFQYGIFGIADMFTLVGLLDFFYKEAPSSMKSLSTSFTWLSLSFGYFLSTVFVNLINAVTKRITPSRQGWLHGQLLDYNNLNLFYWFLAILSCLNFVLYLYSASWYKYKPDDTESNNKPKAKDSDEGLLLAKESSGAKTDEEESEQNAAKRNEEESAQETDDAEAKAPSSEQSNGTK
jgi:peptide/histidine transporter 3/4